MQDIELAEIDQPLAGFDIEPKGQAVEKRGVRFLYFHGTLNAVFCKIDISASIGIEISLIGLSEARCIDDLQKQGGTRSL